MSAIITSGMSRRRTERSLSAIWPGVCSTRWEGSSCAVSMRRSATTMPMNEAELSRKHPPSPAMTMSTQTIAGPIA